MGSLSPAFVEWIRQSDERNEVVKKERILVLQLKRIGDVILTAEATAQLRRLKPDAEIVVVSLGGIGELAQCLPGVDQVLAMHAGRLNAGVWTSVVLGEWDLVLDLTGTDRSALLTWLSRGKQRIGYKKFSSRGVRRKAYTGVCDASVRDLHTVDFHLAMICMVYPESMGSSRGDRKLQIRAAVRAEVETLMNEHHIESGFILIHPGTARREKFWPVQRWIELVRHLSEGERRVILTGTGEGLEEDDIRQLRAAGLALTDLTGRLSLVQLAALIEHAGLAVGVDSMAMHLAALAERPQVVLFGPTNPFHWHPRHDKAIILKASEARRQADFQPGEKPAMMNQISTARVISAIESLLADS